MPYPIAITMEHTELRAACSWPESKWLSPIFISPSRAHHQGPNFFRLVPPSQKAKPGATPLAHRPLKDIFYPHSSLNYVTCLSIKKVSKRSPLNLWFRIPALFTLNDDLKKKSQFISSEKPARACRLKNWVTQPIAINLHLSVFSENSRVVFLPISVEERAVPSLVSAFAMCVAVTDPRMNQCLAQMKNTEKKPQNSLFSLYWKHQVYGRTSWTRTFSFKSVLFLVGLLWACPVSSLHL